MNAPGHTTPAEPLPAQGVYRFCEKVGGCNAWFSRGPDGSIIDFLVARDGLSDAQIVDQLSRGLPVYSQPVLTLIRPTPAAAFWPSAVFAGVVRRQPSG